MKGLGLERAVQGEVSWGMRDVTNPSCNLGSITAMSTDGLILDCNRGEPNEPRPSVFSWLSFESLPARGPGVSGRRDGGMER